MDRTKQKTKFIYALIVFLFLALVVNVILTYKKTQEVKNLNLQKENLLLELSNMKDQNDSLKSRHQEQVLRKEYLEGILNKEEKDKEEYFSNITKLEDAILEGKTDKKIAYLTIDDGPNEETTRKWLDILSEKEVLASFFVVKKDGMDDIYKEIINSGHTVGNHTAGHDIFGQNGIYASKDNFIDDVKQLDEYISSQFEYDMNVLRFPGGSNEPKYFGQDKQEYTKLVFDEGYGYIDWTTSCGDGTRGQAAEAYYASAIRNSRGKNIAVFLTHDDSVNTLEMIPKLIDTIESEGYIFLPLCFESTMVKKQ